MIQEKLLNVQMELKAPKQQFNKFANFNYRSCEDILEAVKPLLQKHNLCLTISDSIKNIGSKNYIVATGILTDIEDKTEISCQGIAREAETKKGMDDSQISGSTSSYARKYMLNGLFAIDDSKDADSQISGSTSSYARKYMLNGLFAIDDSKDADSQKPEPPVTETEVQDTIAKIKNLKTIDELNKFYRVIVSPRFHGDDLKQITEQLTIRKTEITFKENNNETGN